MNFGASLPPTFVFQQLCSCAVSQEWPRLSSSLNLAYIVLFNSPSHLRQDFMLLPFYEEETKTQNLCKATQSVDGGTTHHQRLCFFLWGVVHHRKLGSLFLWMSSLLKVLHANSWINTLGLCSWDAPSLIWHQSGDVPEDALGIVLLGWITRGLLVAFCLGVMILTSGLISLLGLNRPHREAA